MIMMRVVKVVILCPSALHSLGAADATQHMSEMGSMLGSCHNGTWVK